MFDDPNIYYSPEKFDCTTVANLDQGGSYEFDTIHFVKRDDSGQVLAFTDAGCSCPTPFEGQVLADGQEINSKADIERAVMAWWDGGDRGYVGVSLAQCRDLIRKVEASL